MNIMGLLLTGSGIAFLLVVGGFLRKRQVPDSKRILLSCLAFSLALLLSGSLLAIGAGAATEAGATGTVQAASGWAFLGASLATGMACIGAGIAVAVVGAAALGVVGEKPELLGSTLIYLGLAEGIAIYGVIVSLLILGKV